MRFERRKGGPKNEGISRDVYENKGPEIWFLECLEMLMKTNHLWVRLEMLLKTNILRSEVTLQNTGARFQSVWHD